MAMKIGGCYKVNEISGLRWVDFAQENNLNPTSALNRIETLTENLPSVSPVTLKCTTHGHFKVHHLGLVI